MRRARARVWVDQVAATVTRSAAELQLRVGLPEPGMLGSLFGIAGGELSAIACGLGVAVGWAGAAVGGMVHAVHGSLLGAVATELVLAKGIDYGLSNQLRQRGSKAEPFYAAMARAGLEAGWSNPSATLPWWFGSVSFGATGSLDFMIANILGATMRDHFDGLVDAARAGGRELSTAQVERLRALYFEHVPQVAAAMVASSGAELSSSLLRSLVTAASGDVRPELVAGIERRLVTERPGDPLLGVTVGHALAGGVVGCLTGHPLLGIAVAMVDASAEGMLMRAMTAGRYSTLMKLKAELVGKGWDGADLTPAQRAAEFYSQTAQEMRLFGADLRAVADARLATSSGEVARAVQPLDELFVQQLGAAPGGVGSFVQSLFQLAQVDLDRQVSDALKHHAEQPLGATIHDDFPELEAAQRATQRQARAAVLSSWLDAAEPTDLRPSPPPTVLVDPESDPSR